MTSPSRPSVSLTTTSTELPVAWDVLPLGAGQTDMQQVDANALMLFPDRPGEVLMRVRNNGSQPMHLQLEIEGDFPADWLDDPRWQRVANQSRWQLTLDALSSNHSRSEALTLKVPKDFFEQQSALNQAERLTLEHSSQIYLYEQGTERLVGYQTMDLLVRPTATYLNFLPEIYQQSDFLGRFLTIFEQGFDPTMQTLDTFWAYIDPLTAPRALLPFLAKWVAWPLDPKLTERQQRRLLRHAAEIYQWRGSKHGLQLALSAVTDLPLEQDDDDNDIYIIISEGHLTDFVLGDNSPSLGDSPSLGGGMAFHIQVTLHPQNAEQAQMLQSNEEVIRAIIEQEKPAFCTYELVFGEPKVETAAET